MNVRSRLFLLVACWAAVALLLAASNTLARAPRPLIPAMIFGLTGAAVFAHRRSAALRAYVAGFDPRLAIAFHLVRIPFGLAFLREAAQGTLPVAFARVAGPGDLLAGGLVVVALVAAADLTPLRRAVVFAWNTFGLLDMIVVVATAQRLVVFAQDPRMQATLGRFPYAVLPTFVVPMILITHLAVFARLARPHASNEGAYPSGAA
ncbi:MAG: hypothetical protein JNL79_27895 [Myxococcales bacterium]|nr:hypothetical protein [Myxococcales bacterium]